MIKKIAYLIVILFLTTPLIGQEEFIKPKIDLEYEEIKKLKINFVAGNEGEYSVYVVNPMGQKITQPVTKKSFKSQSKKVFNINTKNWNSGTYRVIVMFDGQFIKSKSVKI